MSRIVITECLQLPERVVRKPDTGISLEVMVLNGVNLRLSLILRHPGVEPRKYPFMGEFAALPKMDVSDFLRAHAYQVETGLDSLTAFLSAVAHWYVAHGSFTMTVRGQGDAQWFRFEHTLGAGAAHAVYQSDEMMPADFADYFEFAK